MKKPDAVMRAVDTNVVVRYLTGDHPSQAARAKAAIDADDILISVTALLESEWVLRSVYGFSRRDVAAALRGLAGLPTVQVESPALVAEALNRAEHGMDFADALHLGSAVRCEALLTFDRGFIKRAAGGPVTVMEP